MQIIYILKTLISFAFSHLCISHFIRARIFTEVIAKLKLGYHFF